MRYSRGVRFAAVVCLSLGLASHAYADDIVDRGVQLYQAGDFDAALATFSEAESTSALDRDDVMRVFVHRALVHYALEDSQAMRAELFKLATLDPSYEFGPSVPPPVLEAFAEEATRVDAPIALELDTEEVNETVRARLRVEGDLAGLARAVELHARVPGGEYQTGDGATVELPLPVDEIEYYGLLRGVGQTTLVTQGAAADPIVVSLRPDPITTPTPVEPGEPDEEGGLSAGVVVLIIAGAALLVGGGIVAAVLLSQPEADALGPPMVAF